MKRKAEEKEDLEKAPDPAEAEAEAESEKDRKTGSKSKKEEKPSKKKKSDEDDEDYVEETKGGDDEDTEEEEEPEEKILEEAKKAQAKPRFRTRRTRSGRLVKVEMDSDVNNALAGLLSVSDSMPRMSKRRKKSKKGRKKGSSKKKKPQKTGHFKDGKLVSHKSWTIIEEVFLVGAVVDMFLSRGSLSPKHYGASCWTLIKKNYDSAWIKYLDFLNEYQNGKPSEEKEAEYPFLKTMHHTTIDNHERTQGAMARHFKEMKDRCAKGTTRNFSYYLREWEEIYNVKECLMPPSQDMIVKSPAEREMERKLKEEAANKAEGAKTEGIDNAKDVPAAIALVSKDETKVEENSESKPAETDAQKAESSEDKKDPEKKDPEEEKPMESSGEAQVEEKAAAATEKAPEGPPKAPEIASAEPTETAKEEKKTDEAEPEAEEVPKPEWPTSAPPVPTNIASTSMRAGHPEAEMKPRGAFHLAPGRSLPYIAPGRKSSNYEGRWTHQDEVFLIAAVVHRFLKTGSLASPRGSVDKACWNSIHENFEWLQEQATRISGQRRRPARTVTALLRRFKLIKEHQTTKKSIRALYSDWKQLYCTADGAARPVVPPQSPAHGSTVQQLVSIPMKSKDEDMELPPSERLATSAKKRDVSKLDGGKRDGDDDSPYGSKKLKIVAVDDLDDPHKVKMRIKWTAWDVACLWNGIHLHGNSWSEIKKNFLPLRTTDQVKDKGKRLLRRVGWKTGRTKTCFDKASDEAKEIARQTILNRAIPQIKSYNDPVLKGKDSNVLLGAISEQEINDNNAEPGAIVKDVLSKTVSQAVAISNPATELDKEANDESGSKAQVSTPEKAAGPSSEAPVTVGEHSTSLRTTIEPGTSTGRNQADDVSFAYI